MPIVEVEMCKHGSPRLLCPVCSMDADLLPMSLGEVAKKIGRKAAIDRHITILETLANDSKDGTESLA